MPPTPLNAPARIALLLGALLLVALASTTAIDAYRAHRLAVEAEEDVSWGRLDEARDALERALELTPLDAKLHATLGDLEAARTRWRADEGALERGLAEHAVAVRLNPLDGNRYADYGAALTRAGRYPAADEALAAALARDPANTYYLGLLGRLREAQGRPEEARAVYERAYAIGRNRTFRLLAERLAPKEATP